MGNMNNNLSEWANKALNTIIEDYRNSILDIVNSFTENNSLKKREISVEDIFKAKEDVDRFSVRKYLDTVQNRRKRLARFVGFYSIVALVAGILLFFLGKPYYGFSHWGETDMIAFALVCSGFVLAFFSLYLVRLSNRKIGASIAPIKLSRYSYLDKKYVVVTLWSLIEQMGMQVMSTDSNKSSNDKSVSSVIDYLFSILKPDSKYDLKTILEARTMIVHGIGNYDLESRLEMIIALEYSIIDELDSRIPPHHGSL